MFAQEAYDSDSGTGSQFPSLILSRLLKILNTPNNPSLCWPKKRFFIFLFFIEVSIINYETGLMELMSLWLFPSTLYWLCLSLPALSVSLPALSVSLPALSVSPLALSVSSALCTRVCHVCSEKSKGYLRKRKIKNCNEVGTPNLTDYSPR